MKFLTLVTAFALALPVGMAVAQTTPTAPSTTPAPKTSTPSATTTSPSTTTPSTMQKAGGAAKSVMHKTTKRIRHAATTTKTRSEASLACSAEANTKGLHGKARRTFRRSCIAAKTKAMH